MAHRDQLSNKDKATVLSITSDSVPDQGGNVANVYKAIWNWKPTPATDKNLNIHQSEDRNIFFNHEGENLGLVFTV